VSECLSEEGLLAFVEGRAETASRAAVEAHLCDCRSCREVVGALRSTRGSAGAATTVGDRDGAPQPAEDEVIDEYRIARAIGRGGMGQVYLARDTRLDRDVALKFCSTASASTARRIEREAIALARLAHPNVVVVFGVGEWRGQFYIAMEYVEGGNAREWLRAGPRTWREIVALYVAAGDGLAAAHARGFVHRDFKPDNVLVGDDGRPRVADFGLVGADPTSSDDGTAPSPALSRLTRQDAVIGTVGYMAPEQLANSAVDARADQYAFCVALWEALFGRKPNPAQPFVASARVPRRILAALRRGLEPEREDRFPTMKELLGQLRRDWRTRRVAIAAAAGASVLAVGGYVMFTSGSGADGPIACVPGDPDAREVYVDASSRGAPANGTAACPYKTITSALATRAKVVHVVAGTYDAKLGEKFPLVVRGERSIVGAGVGETRIVGVGRFEMRGTVMGLGSADATLVIGDDRATASIAKLSIVHDLDHPDGWGVVCDRGNLRAFVAATGEPPPPSFVATDVEVAGFDIDVVVGGTLGTSGCNARLERAKVHHAWTGAWVLGCGGVEDVPQGPIASALDVEDSRFEAINAKGNDLGVGVRVWDCTRWLAVRRSHFGTSDIGIWLVNHIAAATRAIVEDNELRHLRVAGFIVDRAAAVERLVGNMFEGISPGVPTTIASRGVGLVFDRHDEVNAGPQLRYARRNTFMDNDVGIEFRGLLPIEGSFDFGRADDPGNNTIWCNATIDGAPVPGGDVVVRAPIDPGAKLSFAGNRWNHAPPTRGDENGADIAVGSAGRASAAAIDASGATPGSSQCSVRSR
jgi:serine/threonine-protein kinase